MKTIISLSQKTKYTQETALELLKNIPEVKVSNHKYPSGKLAFEISGKRFSMYFFSEGFVITGASLNPPSIVVFSLTDLKKALKKLTRIS